MKSKFREVDDIEDLIQQLVDSGQPMPTAQELNLTNKQYEVLRSKYDMNDFGDPYGEFFV